MIALVLRKVELKLLFIDVRLGDLVVIDGGTSE